MLSLTFFPSLFLSLSSTLFILPSIYQCLFLPLALFFFHLTTYLCLSLSSFVYHLPPSLSIFVYLPPSLFTFVYISPSLPPSLYSSIYFPPSLSIFVCLPPSLSIYIHLLLSLPPYLYSSTYLLPFLIIYIHLSTSHLPSPPTHSLRFLSRTI